jgi:hypothetical protein
MKQNIITFIGGCLLSIFMISCQKDEIANPQITPRVPSNSIGTWTHTGSCAGDALTVTFCNQYGNNCGDTKIQQWNGTDWILVAMGTPSAGCLSYTIANAAAGEYRFRGSWTRTGNPAQCSGENTGWVEYTVTIESCGCVDTLVASATCSNNTCNRSVTFTYTAASGFNGDVVIQGGLTHFTTICTVTATGGLVQNTTHPSVTNSNANVTRWEGTVEECGEYSVTITWTSTNGAEEITGEWTVKDEEGNTLATLAPLTCPE